MGKAMLIIVLGLTVIFSGVILSTTSRQTRSVADIARHYERQLARNAASSAADLAISHLYRDFSWRDGYSNLSLDPAVASVQVADVTTDPKTGVPTVAVTAVGRYFEITDTARVSLIEPAYSFFGVWIDNWPSFWTLTTGDTLYAPLHSNRQIKISSTPVFYGRVSSDEPGYTDAGSAAPRFYGGAEFGSPTVPLPGFSTAIDSGYAGGDLYSADATFVFNGDGTYTWTSGAGSGTKSIADHNGVILVDVGDAYVQGVVDGQVTVVGLRDVYIDSSLTCAVSPEGNPASDDFIALLAQRDVQVVDNAANASGVTLHASVAALSHFTVENYNLGAPRGDLRLVGSLVVDRLNPFGTWSGGVLQSGYRFVHVYDRRLRTQRPPFFPLVTGWVEIIERVE